MARAPRDAQAPDPQPPFKSADNPFIKFKNFADQSMSSFLQGITSLPSALSRNAASSPRWEEFDADLKRRDELQSRQNQMRTGQPDARKMSTTESNYFTGDLATEIPARRFCGRYPHAAAELCIPLYSSISDAFLLARRGWETQEGESEVKSLRQTLLLSPYCDVSQTSLVPYLLFSPYSPLVLTQETGDSHYCEAFEELIKCTNGLPIDSPVPRPFYNKGPHQEVPSLHRFGLSWISHLNAQNLLHPPEAISRNEESQTEQDMYDRFLRLASHHPAGAGVSKALENLKSLIADIEQEFPGTKMERKRTLSRIFGEAKSSLPEGHMRKLAEDFEEVFAMPPKFLEQQIGGAREAVERELSSKVTTSNNFASTSTNSDKRILEDFDFDYDAYLNGATPPEVLEKIHFSRLMGETNTEVIQQKIKEAREAAARELDRKVTNSNEIVSTATNSEHRTLEDGLIVTSVTVWKRYANGRESTTMTTHLEDPPRDEHGNPIKSYQTETGKEEKKLKKLENRGWFWS